MIGLKGLKKKWTPNQYLVCPEGYAISKPDALPKTYRVEPVVLAELWRQVIAAEPRTDEVHVSENGLQLHHTQKSKRVGFVDDIFSEVVIQGAGSSLYIYSRSRIGISDRGVNKNRIIRWLGELQKKAMSSPTA